MNLDPTLSVESIETSEASAIRRGWMGVEPTAARSARPASDFEDRGSHRATTTPTHAIILAIRGLVNRATGQSGNWLIGQLGNWSIGQLVNRAIG
jgi:hypothetical protein